MALQTCQEKNDILKNFFGILVPGIPGPFEETTECFSNKKQMVLFLNS
jgi:hypothetical protein